MSKRLETYDEFEAKFIALMEGHLAKDRHVENRDWHVFSARMQAAYCYASQCLMSKQGSIDGEDLVETLFKSITAILSTFHVNLPEGGRNAILGYFMARLNAEMAALMNDTTSVVRSEEAVPVSAEGTGRA